MSQAKREIPRAPETAGIETVGALSETMLGSVQSAFKTVADVQQELLTFTTQRFERNAEAYNDLLRCKNFDDLAALQQNWAKSVSKHYSEHFARLAELTQSVMHKALTPNGQNGKRHH